ncbi:MAG TPA: carbonic anhydrase family protein [Gemmataceae bacterium]|jgi:carbonic anhydrase
MCDVPKKPVDRGQLNRRSFIKVPAAAAAAGLLGGGLFGSVAHADALTQEQRDKMTPDEILAEMKRGNERFRKGEEPKRDFLAEQKASAKGQFPAAMILSCIDSRAPAETIMDLGLGNAFNARVAGNISNEDILGSMEFACKVAGAKVVLVMGHTACGAIKGAIDNVELGNLTALLAKIRPAVKATEFDGDRSSKNAAYVNAVARKNVELTMAQILEKSPVLRELESKRAIKVAGAMYDLESATVQFFA